MFNLGGTTTLTNCTVSGNSARADGGGVLSLHPDGDDADQLHASTGNSLAAMAAAD